MCTKSSSIVVIPIYKEVLSLEEIESFRQCCKILASHPICLVCPNHINLSCYHNIANAFSVELIIEPFSQHYFDGIYSYNRLMTDISFYIRFHNYQYMLIYQLDAWVFRDELDYWCEQGFDYIGAPWFENYGTYEQGNKLWAVGNGGFSLRRIQYFIDLLKHNGPLKDANTLNLEPSLKNRIYKFLYSKGYQNSVTYFRKDPTLFEDVFFTVYLNNTRFRSKVPSVENAALFAFEKSPSYLYSMTGKLPFGCHAWQKYEYEEFWCQHIH